MNSIHCCSPRYFRHFIRSAEEHLKIGIQGNKFKSFEEAGMFKYIKQITHKIHLIIFILVQNLMFTEIFSPFIIFGQTI